MVLEAVKQCGGALQFASPELKDNKEMVLEAIKQRNWAYWVMEFASAELKGDRQVILKAVKQDGRVLRFASPALKGDKEVVLEALHENLDAVRYASSKLKKKLPAEVKGSLEAHRDFAFFLHGARPLPSPDKRESQAQVPPQELPVQMIHHQGCLQAVVMKRLVADFIGVPFGRAFILRRGLERERQRQQH